MILIKKKNLLPLTREQQTLISANYNNVIFHGKLTNNPIISTSYKSAN